MIICVLGGNKNMDEKKVLKKSSQIVTREIEGDMILLPLYKSSKDLNYIYTLNETAAAAWELLDGKTSLGEIKKKLMGKYDISEEKLDKQLNELIKDLRAIKAVV